MYLECGESVPDASLVDAKDREVLWFDLADVRFLNNGKRTTFHVVDTFGVELDRSGSGAWPVPLTDISTIPSSSAYIMIGTCNQMTNPSDEFHHVVAPLLHPSSAMAAFPAGSSKTSFGCGGYRRWL